MTVSQSIILICSGIIVGFINTLAGGGTVISMAVLMMGIGLPVDIANGTNRIAVFIQNIVAVGSFRKQKILDLRKGITLAIPTVIGSILGALIAVSLNKDILNKAIAVLMVIMIILIFIKPEKWLKGQPELLNKKISPLTLFMFFLIGIYGGFLHAGVGYFLLAAIVLGAGFDLVKGNAIKNFIVLCYTPFSLAIFMYEGKVFYIYGLVHAIGNIIGAYVASKYCVTWGANFIRWVMVAVIIFTSCDLLGIMDLKTMIGNLL